MGLRNETEEIIDELRELRVPERILKSISDWLDTKDGGKPPIKDCTHGILVEMRCVKCGKQFKNA